MTDSNNSQPNRSLPPYEAYASPSALLSDSSVERDEKIDILRVWERDLRQLMVAEGEGLDTAAQGTREAPEQLQEVSDALEQIGAVDLSDQAQTDVSGSSTS